MTVGNFTELYGIGGDLGVEGFDSISGSNLQIVYGLNGDDSLNSTTTFFGGSLLDGKTTTILVGGTGRNMYQVRNNSTAVVIENDNDRDNILWTTIGSSGISLFGETSFVAEIDNRHLYLGNTATDQYVILIDWQQPANRIETFDLTEGYVSYEDFVDSYRDAINYRGNFTWSELIATGEIDLDRLGLSPDTVNEQFATIKQRSAELENGIFFSEAERFEYGINRDDYLAGGFGAEGLFSYGDRDTLEGNSGNDFYFVDVEKSNGSEIYDVDGSDYLIVATSNNLQNLANDLFFNPIMDLRSPAIYNDSPIELSFPSPGKIGLQKIDNHLVIDINRDGVAEKANDLTILDFFDGSGRATRRAVERINNVNSNDIVTFFANSAQEQLKNEDFGENTVYRFYDRSSGVHFYTSDKNERNYVYDRLDNYIYEGASYAGVDPKIAIDSLAVYRFYNRDSGSHFYTVNENERNVILQELDNYSYEGEAFSAHNIQVENSIPIYRFYNFTTGSHFYTPSDIERDIVIDELPDFKFEGIAYYALPVDSGD